MLFFIRFYYFTFLLFNFYASFGVESRFPAVVNYVRSVLSQRNISVQNVDIVLYNSTYPWGINKELKEHADRGMEYGEKILKIRNHSSIKWYYNIHAFM